MKKEKIQRKNWRFVRVLEKRAKEAKAKGEAEQSVKRKDAIRKAIEITEQRDAAFFDALEGSPPEWMAKADIAKWREARRSMLDKYPKDQVQAWIKGAPGPLIPDDDFGEIAQSLQILRAAAYSMIAKQRSKREPEIKRNLAQGPKAAGQRSSEAKGARLEKVQAALKTFRGAGMNLNWSAKRVCETLLGDQQKYFEDGRQPYKSPRGLYDAVRKIRD